MRVFSREITKKERAFFIPKAHTQFQELKPQLIISHDILFSSVMGGKGGKENESRRVYCSQGISKKLAQEGFCGSNRLK